MPFVGGVPQAGVTHFIWKKSPALTAIDRAELLNAVCVESLVIADDMVVSVVLLSRKLAVDVSLEAATLWKNDRYTAFTVPVVGI